MQHPTDQYTHQKCRKYINLCLRFFLSHLRVFSAHYFVNLPPFRNSYPGSHVAHSSPVPTTVLLFQAYISRPEQTHTSYLLIIYLWCIFTCSIISISFNISHDIGIEISRKYYRCWYRYIPKISHDIFRILDTIPNTTSKQCRTHTWGYASLPPSWLYV